MTTEQITKLANIAAACAMVSFHAAEIWVRLFEYFAKLARKQLHHEQKQAFNGAIKAAENFKFHMMPITDFGILICDGENDAHKYDLLRKSAREIAKITFLYLNSEEGYLTIESVCKMKQKANVDYSILEKI